MPKFYLRRILRIWPIYYLIIIIAVLFVLFNVITETSNLSLTITLYSLLLANVGYSLSLGLITITPLWSVGVEEQFLCILAIPNK
jgi:peptidoglycan/LPS O-acetylase OafA/YrhL